LSVRRLNEQASVGNLNMKSAGRPIINALKGRLYSAQAAAKSQGSENKGLQVSKLANGAVVASVDNGSTLSRIGIAYSAGSRNETYSGQGSTHLLRAVSDLSTKDCSSLKLVKQLQQHGASLSCTTSRESIIYSLDCLRNDNVSPSLLASAATAPALNPWEFDNAKQQMMFDLSLFSNQPNQVVTEALHKAAYRKGLGNSLFAPLYKIASLSTDDLSAFISNNFTTSRMAVVGVAVDHDDLVRYASNLQVTLGSGAAAEATKYYGGEVRVETESQLVYAALATEGVSASSADALAVAVLQQIMGTGPYIKYSAGLAGSKVAQAAAKAASLPHSASCFNASYSDNGLFGFVVAGQSSEMGKILKSVVSAFSDATKGAFSAEDVQRGKNQLKAALLMDNEATDSLLATLAESSLQGNVTDLDAVSKAIDALTPADIASAAKKVVNGKPSMAAVGDLSSTPFLEDLLK